MLGSVLNHALGKLIVHVVAYALSGLFLFLGLFADDLGLHRPLSRESFHHGLSLELNEGFRQQWVVYTACAGPRFATIFYFKAKKLQTVNVSLHPVLTRVQIILVIADKLASKLLKQLAVEVFSHVLVKFFVLARLKLDFEAVHLNTNRLRVLNLDLDGRFAVHQTHFVHA